MVSTKQEIEDYAISLVHYKLYPSLDLARKESIRWHKKMERGLVEPLLCPHRLNTETEWKTSKP